jgi:hypothetical protein
MDGLSQLRAIGSRLLTNANRSGRAPGSARVCVHANGLVVQHQRRFAEAEQYHRQALDIKLRFDDRDSAATNYQRAAANTPRLEELQAAIARTTR